MVLSSEVLHVGVGAGFSNDRRELGVMAAKALSQLEGPRYLIFECLAERTLAMGIEAREPDGLVRHALSFLAPCIALCARHRIKIISNFGGHDPRHTAQGIAAWLATRGLRLKVAYVLGDALPNDAPAEGSAVLARNAYTGAAGIVAALQDQADIVVTGRVADPALTVGPAVHELGIAWDDWTALAGATLAGHLIECGTHVCGGYFADTDKPVADLHEIGPPIASLSRDGMILRKPLGGGLLNTATVTEQLLYEVHDPANYLTPDVIVDVSEVEITAEGDMAVRLAGVKGKPRPSTLKTLTCLRSGWIGEAEIFYLGQTAADRAGLARDIVQSRCAAVRDLRFDLFNGEQNGVPMARLRVAARHDDQALVARVLDEVDALYVNGPAGGGGVRTRIDPVIKTQEGVIDQDAVCPKSYLVAAA